MLSSDEDSEKSPLKQKSEEVVISVHDRPKVSLYGHDLQRPLLVHRGKAIEMPVTFNPTGMKAVTDSKHVLEYTFSPGEESASSDEQGGARQLHRVELKDNQKGPRIDKPGLYTLQSVSTPFCSGDVSLSQPRLCL